MRFLAMAANYCLAIRSYCNKLYIGDTGRRVDDRFREHLRDVKRNDKDASAPLIPMESTRAYHSTNLFLFSRYHFPINGVAPLSAYKHTDNPQFFQSL